jgi:flagellar assembly factor FliW
LTETAVYQLESALFGTIEVPEEKIFQFAKGIPGLEVPRAFAFIEVEDYQPLVWMIALDGTLHLPVYPLAKVTLDDIDEISKDVYLPQIREYLTLHPDCVAYVIIKLATPLKKINLKAPVIADLESKTGYQMILDRFIFASNPRS